MLSCKTLIRRSNIFTRAHQIAREYKRLGVLGKYRDIFAQCLRAAYEEARKAEARKAEAEEAKAEEAKLTSELTICTEQLMKAQDKNDYVAAEDYKLQRSELQRKLRLVRAELQRLAA